MSFGPDAERWTACACVGDAAVVAVEFCEVETVGGPSSVSDRLVAKYNVHSSKQTRIIQQNSFNLGKHVDLKSHSHVVRSEGLPKIQMPGWLNG